MDERTNPEMSDKNSEATSHRAEAATTKCIACRQDIGTAATICAECGSYQNWRRHLQFSNTVLSLLVALVSVSGLTGPIIITALRPDSSEVSASVRAASLRSGTTSGAVGEDEVEVYSYDLAVTVLLTNSGNKPGFLESATFVLKNRSGTLAEGNLLIPDSQAIVTPGTFRLVTFHGEAKPASAKALPLGRLSKASPPELEISGSYLHVRLVQYNQRILEFYTALPHGKWRVSL